MVKYFAFIEVKSIKHELRRTFLTYRTGTNEQFSETAK